MTRRPRPLSILTTALALVVAGTLIAAGTTARAADADFTAAGSARQVYAVGLAGGAKVSLLSPSGKVLRTRTATPEGGVLFRNVAAGPGYRVRDNASGTTSGPLTVHTNTPKQWNASIYDQEMPSDGYGYLTMRDGTKLAYSVHPPNSPAGVGGLPEGFPTPPGPAYAPPYPTLIEYSGYGYADPDGPNSGIAAIANLMGFAVVDIQMRGTGCSGGAFDFFEPLQSIDGYDIIETVARQDWVKGGKVGMMGISYGGISQLFTAQHRPPSLAAIAPLSVIDATATTLYPGGLRNDGFAVAWAEERQRQAQPAGTGKKGTQAYAEKRIAEGDTVCQDNQALHGEAASLITKIRRNSYYRPKVADPLDPVSFVRKINVPTFMACQWQDEQTGGHCPSLVRNFTGTDKKWFTFTNGTHVDSLDPETLNRMYDFLMLYVAKTAPAQNAAALRAAAPVIYQAALGTPQDDPITLPPDPIQEQPTYDAALAAFEALPSIRVLFDNGAGESPEGRQTPGNPYPAYEHSFKTLPVPGVKARSWYFARNGILRGEAPRLRNVDRYTSDPRLLPGNSYAGGTGSGSLWGNASQWEWDWKQRKPGSALSYLTPKLRRGVTTIGAGAVRLWVRSSTRDVDFQVTVTEVRGGKETFVQSGWLRGSSRKLARTDDNLFKQRPTLLEPIPTFRKRDAQPMPRRKFTKVVVPLYFQGHAYRPGSRIRVTISAPGGEQPIWSFPLARPLGQTANVRVVSSRWRPSRLILPVVPGLSIDAEAPPCPSLRNQPCRDYRPIRNR